MKHFMLENIQKNIFCIKVDLSNWNGWRIQYSQVEKCRCIIDISECVKYQQKKEQMKNA